MLTTLRFPSTPQQPQKVVLGQAGASRLDTAMFPVELDCGTSVGAQPSVNETWRTKVVDGGVQVYTHTWS
jgi:hypothetical protein